MSRKTIITLISLAVSGTLVFIFIIPLWSSTKTLRVNIAQQNQEVVRLEELLIKTEQLTRKYQEAEEEAQKVFLALPKEEDIPFLLVQFESLAISNGLLLESIDFSQISSSQETAKRSASQPGEAQKKLPGLRSTSIELTLSGSYNAFKKYLTGLENSVRSLEVSFIKFDVGQQDDQVAGLVSGIFGFSLRIDVYYQ